jgi:ribosomal protein S9
MSIQNTTLATTATTILTGTGSLGTATTTVYLCNKTPSTIVVNVYAVNSGFTANTNNIIYSNVALTTNETYIMDVEKIFLGVGDMLQANASAANSVVATVSSIGL